MTDYLVPKNQHRCEIEVKRSRFIAYVAHTPGVEAAKSFIQNIKSQYPDARHHCYGFIAGKPSDSNMYGFSDDNEPSGTAGMPIFSHLEHANIGETTVVVVRYFGGTKLGTGGLARAYGDAAKSVLSEADLVTKVVMETGTITVPFTHEAQVRRIIENQDGHILEASYGTGVELSVEIPQGVDLALPFQAEWSSDSTI
ncbi:YigZ family protein [Bermanella sp. R86510]|uniref:YigZ family protein n=1 Tax=unclassified Bermanella TaxID=2627862 RepID=UPI0037C89BB0